MFVACIKGSHSSSPFGNILLTAMHVLRHPKINGPLKFSSFRKELFNDLFGNVWPGALSVILKREHG